MIFSAPFRAFAILICAALVLRADPPGYRPGAFRDGRVLVGFREGVSEFEKSLVYALTGFQETKRIGKGVHVINVGPGIVLSALQALKAFGVIRYIEPDHMHKASAAAPPNDPSFGLQWALRNTGQTVNGFAGVPGKDDSALPAWSITTGASTVVVASLDTGTQYTHQDLFTNMWNNPGGIGGCAAGTHGYNVLNHTCDPMDDETLFGGHGSHVAGILGAVGNNGEGIAGTAWTTNLMSVKWIGSDAIGFTSDLIAAMDWVIAAKQAGVNIRIVNDSATYSGTAFSQALVDEIDLLAANDILFVTSSGNDTANNDTTPRYPCSLNRPNMICAAAADMDGSLWVGSNWGPSTVHLAAPGASIYSTYRLSNYGFLTGGSMAAPQVSAAAAMILSLGYQPYSALKSMILGGVDLEPSLAGKVSTGGRLNLCKALPGCTTAVAATPAITTAPLITGVPGYGSIVGASAGVWSGAPATYQYQWSRCGSGGGGCFPIPGATGQTYGIFDPADSGATLAVSVTASNSAGSAAAQSPVSALVAATSPAFGIGSTILNGATLSGSVAWTATPSLAAGYVQFYIDGAFKQTITSAPYTYNKATTGLLDSATLGPGSHVLGIRALASDLRTFSYYVAVVNVGAGAPVNTSLPVISGVAAVGRTLTVSNGSWSGGPTGFTYQWLRCNAAGASCAPIAGAASSTYIVASADANLTLRATVTASNASGSSSATSAALTIGVPTITTASLPSGPIGAGYSATLNASGGSTPYAWSLSAGTLPAGLALAAATGAITGTPTTAGTSNITARVTDSLGQTANKAFSITIASAGSPISLLQSNSGEGSGVNSLSAGFPNTNTAGNLIVAFLRMSSTSQTVQVTDSAGNAYVDAVAQVQNTDGHQVHIFYAKNIRGGANTVTAAFSAANNHPWLAIYEYSGLSASAPLDKTASAQGTSAAAATGATAATGSANSLVFGGIGLPNVWAGTISGGSGYALLLQNTATARSGNEHAIVSAAGSYNATFSLSASAGWSAAVATFAAAGAPAPLSIATTSLPGATVGIAYSATLAASGGTTPYTWSLSSGTLPPGLALNASSGAITGTPTTAGPSNFTVQVSDAQTLVASRALSIAVTAASSIALVQSSAVGGSSAGSISRSFTAPNTAGNLIIAFIRMSTSTQTVNVTDSLGNTYADAVSHVQTNDGHQIHLFYARNIRGGANTVTAAFSSANGHPWLSIYEYRGLSATAPLDRTAHAQGRSIAPSSGATAATTAPNELVFAGAGFPFNYGGSVSAGSGFALQLQDTATSRAAAEAGIVSAAGAYTGNFSVSASTDWSAVVATFK